MILGLCLMSISPLITLPYTYPQKGLLWLTYLSFLQDTIPVSTLPSYWSTLQEPKWKNHGLRCPREAKRQVEKKCGIHALV